MEETLGRELEEMLASDGLKLEDLSNTLKRAELVEVIRILVVIGKGTNEDPVRREVQYWTKDGKLIGRGFA